MLFSLVYGCAVSIKVRPTMGIGQCLYSRYIKWWVSLVRPRITSRESHTATLLKSHLYGKTIIFELATSLSLGKNGFGIVLSCKSCVHFAIYRSNPWFSKVETNSNRTIHSHETPMNPQKHQWNSWLHLFVVSQTVPFLAWRLNRCSPWRNPVGPRKSCAWSSGPCHGSCVLFECAMFLFQIWGNTSDHICISMCLVIYVYICIYIYIYMCTYVYIYIYKCIYIYI